MRNYLFIIQFMLILPMMVVVIPAMARQRSPDSVSAKAYGEEALRYYNNGDYHRAAQSFDSSARLWKGTNTINYLKALNDKATALMFNSEYHKALLTFFDCLDMEDSIHNAKLTGQVLNNIGLVYESIGDEDNALAYEKRSVTYKLVTGDSVSLARSYGNIGNAFEHKAILDSAIYYEQLSYRFYLPSQDQEGMSNALGDIGNMYIKMNKPDSAIAYLSRGLAMALKLDNSENSGNFENELAQIYLVKGDLTHAWQYASMAAARAPQITDNEFLQNNYDLMYRYYKRTGNTAKAFSYLEKLNAVNDSIFQQKINIQNEKIAFEFEYKQKKLKDSLVYQTQLDATQRQIAETRNRLIIALLWLLLAVLIAIIIYIRSKLLRRQLESERQNVASRGVLQGQEAERSRLAKDLHDGLGGLLTGAKHSIIHMKETIVMDGESISAFEKSLTMIDTAMTELRRVAQNMMPEALAKFGLEEALKDYCAAACTPTVKVVFASFGDNLPIDNAGAIFIYRIIQELVNNALKHAEATRVMVQLVKGDGWVTLSVEDNGKGFDVETLKQSAGSGWGNIKSRVDYLNGNLDLRSEAGTGTSVNIELKTTRT